jgi:hypothetical protein
MITQADVLECELASRTYEITVIERWARIVHDRERISPDTDIRPLLLKIEELDGRVKDLPRADWSFVRCLAALYWIKLTERFQALPVSGSWWRWLKERDDAVLAYWCLCLLAIRAWMHPLISPSLTNLQPVLHYIDSD